jgi:hypothetical protein
VEVDWSALAGDDTAYIADAFCRSEFNAQDLGKFGWEDVVVGAAVDERLVPDRRCGGV